MPAGRAYYFYTDNLGKYGWDANLLHEKLEAGSYFFQVSGASVNFPVSGGGMLLHTQRSTKGAVSTSQEIEQRFTICYTGYKGTWIRYGFGNGTSIDWTDWLKIQLTTE